jgi:acetate kinase
MRVLVLNAGSSTLKASVLDGDGRDPLFATTLEWGADASRAEGRAADFEALLERLVVEGIPVGSIEAIGHRVVHGGTRFTAPTIVDDEVLVELDALADLAPLHNPVAVETIRATLAALPGVPEAAAFDTAFHASLPPAEFMYPLPDAWVSAHGLRRFGFHGLSVEWSVTRAAELLDTAPDRLGLVVAHLGSGCSVTAVDGSRSASTSMGMTPLEGLMMGTRSGSIDPGILLRLLHAGVSIDDLGDGLEHASGLLAVADSADMRELLDRVSAGDSDAELAVELFVRRAAQGIAAAATALADVDALVFTGGIGEHAAPVRERIVGRLGMLGLPPSLGESETDAVLTARGARPAVLRVAAREDLVIAEATRRLLD